MRKFYVSYLLTFFIFNGLNLANALDVAKVRPLEDGFILKDWVPDQDINFICQGYYQVPDIKLEKKPTIYADNSSFKLNNQANLSGNIEFFTEEQNFKADSALINYDPTTKKPSEIKIANNIEIFEPSFRIISNNAVANLKEKYTVVYNPYFHYYPKKSRGSADKITLYKDKPIEIINGTYTTCAPNDDAWYLHFKKLYVDQKNNSGEGYHNFLYIKNTPIFYVPYISFPLKPERKTGFLVPYMANTNQSGFNVNLPFYVNLAKNYDATIEPRYYSKRGLQTGLEARHIFKNISGVWYAEFIPDDKEFSHFRKHKLSETINRSPDDPRVIALNNSKNQRYAFAVNQSIHVNHFLFNINYNRVSDANYFQDYSKFNLFKLQPEDHLLQQFEILGNISAWQIKAEIKDYQTLNSWDSPILVSPYKIKPKFEAHRNFNYEKFNFNIDFNTTTFRHSRRTEGNRTVFIPTISYPIEKTYGFIKPKIIPKYVKYNINNSHNSTNMFTKSEELFFPIFSLDSGLIFEKNYNNKNYPANYSQTLEPRLFYLYAPYKNQNNIPIFDTGINSFDYKQLFRENRFSSYDRQSNANQVSLALSTRIINNETSDENFLAYIGQIFYFQDIKTSLCNQNINKHCVIKEIPGFNQSQSPLVGFAQYKFSKHWNIESELQYDSSIKKITKSNFGFNYDRTQGNIERIFNLDYNFLDNYKVEYDSNTNELLIDNTSQNISQVSLSFKWGLNSNLHLVGFTHYDVQSFYNFDSLAGVEYESCCWAIRFGASRDLLVRETNKEDREYKNTVFFQFALKGLTNIGSNMNPIFTKKIPGYKPNFGKK
tara:strand:- start:1108 stop:3588 length:2481 start_codon:yes stop_codon:yes gene_type:complete